MGLYRVCCFNSGGECAGLLRREFTIFQYPSSSAENPDLEGGCLFSSASGQSSVTESLKTESSAGLASLESAKILMNITFVIYCLSFLHSQS